MLKSIFLDGKNVNNTKKTAVFNSAANNYSTKIVRNAERKDKQKICKETVKIPNYETPSLLGKYAETVNIRTYNDVAIDDFLVSTTTRPHSMSKLLSSDVRHATFGNFKWDLTKQSVSVTDTLVNWENSIKRRNNMQPGSR